MSLAPVVLFVYNRPWHTEQTLVALENNALSIDSELYVFCDGPKENATQEDIKNIQKVRELVRQRKWCGEVHVKLFEKNIGCRDIIIQSITEVVTQFQKVIVLEDDIITSPTFLSYMNLALNHYEGRKSVFSISAHSHSPEKYQIPEDYDFDVYVSPRIFNWGWGTWADRWLQTDWSFNYYDLFINSTFQIDAFNRCGDDLEKMLREEYNGQSSAWDIQFTFSHFMNHAVSIIPCIPYTKNIGLDGSGTHCSVTNTAVEYSLNKKENPIFLDVLYEDKRIINLIYSSFCFRSRPLWQRAVNRLSRMLGQRNVFVVKKKIFT
jgi:hypothetical protein